MTAPASPVRPALGRRGHVTADRPHPRMRLLFVAYVALVLSGSFKGAWETTPLSGVDPTLLFGLCSVGLAVVIRALSPVGRPWDVDEAAYAIAYTAFLLYFSAAAVGVASGETTLKLMRVLVFNTAFVLVPLLVIRRRRDIEELSVWLLFGTTLIIGAAAASFTTGLLRLAGTADNYQGVGRVAGLASLLALHRAVHTSRLPTRASWFGASLLFVAAAVASGTRQAVVGILTAMVVFGLLALRAPGRGRAFRAVISATMALTVVGALAFGAVSSTASVAGVDRISRTVQAVTSEGVRGEQRIELWQAGLEQWRDAPVLGGGPASFFWQTGRGVYEHPHNIFVEFLVDTGIIGLVLGTALLMVPLIRIYRRMSLDATSPFDAAYVFMLTAAQFSGDLASNRWLFAFGALVVAWSPTQRSPTREGAQP